MEEDKRKLNKGIDPMKTNERNIMVPEERGVDLLFHFYVELINHHMLIKKKNLTQLDDCKSSMNSGIARMTRTLKDRLSART